MAASVIERNRCDLFATQRVQECAGHIAHSVSRNVRWLRLMLNRLGFAQRKCAKGDPGVGFYIFPREEKVSSTAAASSPLQIELSISGRASPRRGRVTAIV
jgi:hypothetical protein